MDAFHISFRCNSAKDIWWNASGLQSTERQANWKCKHQQCWESLLAKLKRIEDRSINCLIYWQFYDLVACKCLFRQRLAVGSALYLSANWETSCHKRYAESPHCMKLFVDESQYSAKNVERCAHGTQGCLISDDVVTLRPKSSVVAKQKALDHDWDTCQACHVSGHLATLKWSITNAFIY